MRLVPGWPQPRRGDSSATAGANSGPGSTTPGGAGAAAVEILGGGGGGSATVIASTGCRGVESVRRVEAGFVGALTMGGAIDSEGIMKGALLGPLPPPPLRRSMDEGCSGVPLPL